MFQYSKSSAERLERLHPTGKKVMRRFIQITRVDYGIAETYRPIKVQQDYYKIGRRLENGIWVVDNPTKIITNIDGVYALGAHNYDPSYAWDIYAWVNGKSNYTERYLNYLAGGIITLSNVMFERGEIDHEIEWGSNWDGDGELITDQSLIDGPHFQIKGWKLLTLVE